jgi:hypothetical protein
MRLCLENCLCECCLKMLGASRIGANCHLFRIESHSESTVSLEQKGLALGFIPNQPMNKPGGTMSANNGMFCDVHDIKK